ncbi:MAG: conjugal transfer protein TraO [Dysgonamonadaceae bacterium]|jgi:hypothetical protein|nr:conjugal transfer protein TraO [Dysgonamonadaceae bacterium]
MKHLLFTVMLCIAVSEISAQRYMPGMCGLQITAGVAPKNGFYSSFAFSQYTKRADRWLFGAEYLEKRHPYEDTNIPQSVFTVDAGYYLKFLSDSRKTFFLSLGASATAGYETVNWNNKVLFDGATINNSDNFLYGGALTLESEIYLSDRVVLIANARERLLAGSSVGKFHTQFGLGIKVIIK